MSAGIYPTYEISVRIKGNKPIERLNWDSGEKFDKSVKMLHREARTAEQACDWVLNWASRLHIHLKILSCRKVDAFGDLERRTAIQTDMPEVPNPYKSALAMDEMVWKRRNLRRRSMIKDKRDS